jgi:hypothetical protein
MWEGKMIFRNIGLMISAFAVSLSAASAVFAEDDGGEPPSECLCEPPEPDPEPTKGNNGWGNGIDGVNPGTEKGGTKETKANREGWPGSPSDKFDGR